MFSHLDNIFKAQMRHAEQLDTRQAIQRHERDDERKKRDERDHKDDSADDNDVTPVISVRALKTFLEQLAKDAEKSSQAPSEDQNAASDPITAPKHPSQAGDPMLHENAARAAAAYQRTYQATHETEAQSFDANAIPDIQLSPEELRIIARLIKDLDILLKQHIMEIRLEKSSSFLQSIVNAVDTILNAPSGA